MEDCCILFEFAVNPGSFFFSSFPVLLCPSLHSSILLLLFLPGLALPHCAFFYPSSSPLPPWPCFAPVCILLFFSSSCLALLCPSLHSSILLILLFLPSLALHPSLHSSILSPSAHLLPHSACLLHFRLFVLSSLFISYSFCPPLFDFPCLLSSLQTVARIAKCLTLYGRTAHPSVIC